MADNMRDMTLNLIVNSQVNRIKEFNNNLKNTEKSIEKTTTKVGWLGKAFRRVFGAYIGIQTVKSFVQTYRSLDLMRRSIEGLTKSTQDWEYIQKEAFRTATDIEVVARGYRNFYAAATMAGVDKSGVQNMYSNILEAGRAVGATQRQVEGALLALEQMFSKGKVSMEELRRQLGNALPGAFEIAAKSMGVTTQEFNNMIKKGVQAIDLVPKFTAEYRKTFEKSFPEAMKSLDAAIVNLHSSWKLFQYDFGRSGAGREVAKIVVQISQILQSNKLKMALQSLAYVIGKLLSIIRFLIDNLGTIIFFLSPIMLGGALAKIIALIKDVVKWVYGTNLALSSTQLALFRIFLLLGWIEEAVAFFTDKEGLLETAIMGKNHSWIDRLARVVSLLGLAYITIGSFTGFKLTRGFLGKFKGNKLKKWAGVEENGTKIATNKGGATESPIIDPRTNKPYRVPNNAVKGNVPKVGMGGGSLLSGWGAVGTAAAILPFSVAMLKDIYGGGSKRRADEYLRQIMAIESKKNNSWVKDVAVPNLTKTENFAQNVTYNPQYQINATTMTPEQLKEILEEKDRSFWAGLNGGIPKFASGGSK